MTSRRALQTLSTLEVSLLCSLFMLRLSPGQTLSIIHALWRITVRPIPERALNCSSTSMAPITERRHVSCVCEGQRD